MAEEKRWMIYGAYGSTGRKIVRNACSKGHSPIVAGRNPEKVHQLGLDYGLAGRVFDLSSPDEIHDHLADIDLVLNVAGPYSATWRPILSAAIRRGIHYIDVAGEFSVLREMYERSDEARQAGVAVVPACGFDVVPTDTLVANVARRITDPTRLELVLDPQTTPSRGTIRAALEVAAGGGWIRHDGTLIPQQLGTGAHHVEMPYGRRQALPVPLAELESAWRTTSIDSIRTSVVLPERVGAVGAEGIRLATPLLRFDPVRRLTGAVATLFSQSSDRSREREAKPRTHSLAMAEIENREGDRKRLWLRVEREPYSYTAISALLAVERTLEGIEPGAHTPTQAFGRDFGLEIDGTRLLEEEELFDLEGVREISIDGT